MLNAPACSFTDRIEVLYNQSDSVVISPKEREEFIKELLKVNPNIQVKL
ncbi:DUF1200 protein [Flavobacterium limnosediminis JC2902]|uniref:DUF1200 protein n=2 Tax=Flavobacterium TaxID=237 RepID=V6SSV6_9FLAO|nr:DUF1200 protein [Flavobacterium limnosediminis JC2902]